MDKAYLSKTPMVISALEKDTDPFWTHVLNTHTLVPLEHLCILQITQNLILLLQ
jgi:hypothetical protein